MALVLTGIFGFKFFVAAAENHEVTVDASYQWSWNMTNVRIITKLDYGITFLTQFLLGF